MFNAPVIWLDHWNDIQSTLDSLDREPHKTTYRRRCDLQAFAAWLTAARRLQVAKWYHNFRSELRGEIFESLKLLH